MRLAFMRRALFVVFALGLIRLSPASAQENEAEKLFREMEKKIAAAKGIEADVDMDLTDIKRKAEGKFKVSLLLTRDNKARLKLAGKMEGMDVRMDLISDGSRLKASKRPAPPGKEIEEKATPKYLHAMLARTLSRIGLAGVDAVLAERKAGEKEKAPEIESLIRLSDFKSGGQENIRGHAAKVLSYSAHVQKHNDTVSVTLWLDATTLLPLKRVVTTMKDPVRITELYNRFTLDPKVDAKAFELPK
jgi:outer membrane lipoprotein-sorting protein